MSVCISMAFRKQLTASETIQSVKPSTTYKDINHQHKTNYQYYITATVGPMHGNPPQEVNFYYYYTCVLNNSLITW